MKINSTYYRTVDDSKLWNDIKNGDERAFSSIFEKYYEDLVRYGSSLSPFPEKIKDCVQDVFADVWLYRQNLQDSVVVKAYLLSSVRKRIARLHERDRIFRKTSSVDSLEFLYDFSIERQLIADEELVNKVHQLNKLINDLPSRQKEALYLRYHHGLTVEQIAKMLQVNYQSATNLIHRGIVNLRKEWKENIVLILLLSTSII